MLDAQRTKSQQVYSQYQAERTKVINDHTLSDQGKREQLAQLEAGYKRQMGTIKDEAAQELNAQRQRATQAAAAAREKAVEAKRATLGDMVYSTVLMRQLEAKTSVEIARWFEDAAEGFEKTLVGMGQRWWKAALTAVALVVRTLQPFRLWPKLSPTIYARRVRHCAR